MNDEVYIEELRDGKFVQVPIGSSLFAIRVDDKTIVNVFCDGSEITIRAGGIGPKRISISPIETDAIKVIVQDVQIIGITEENNNE